MNCKHCLKRITDILKEHKIKVKDSNLELKTILVKEINDEALNSIKEAGFVITSIE
jgi:copper chaperone CopZ